MAKGKKKKSKKKDAAAIEENGKVLKRFLKLYEQLSAEENCVVSTEVTKTIRKAIEEGENFSQVDFSKIFFSRLEKNLCSFLRSDFYSTNAAETNKIDRKQ